MANTQKGAGTVVGGASSSSASAAEGTLRSIRRPPSRELPPLGDGRTSREGERGRGTSSARAHSGSLRTVSRERAQVISMMDEEIERLRPELALQIIKNEQMRKDLKVASKEEKEEGRNQSLNAAEREKRRLQVTSRLQSVVRGWLVRKRIVAAMDHRTVQNLRRAAQLPDLLRKQLKQLQHSTHALKYRDEERFIAAVKLQAWWRLIAARRVVKLIQWSQMLQAISAHMGVAATNIQAWYRGVTTKLSLRDQIQERMDQTREKQFRDMEIALHCIIQIQRGYRAKLARRQRIRLQLALLGLPAPDLFDLPPTPDFDRRSTKRSCLEESKLPTVLIDSWRISSAPGAVPVTYPAPCCGNAGVAIESPPQNDREVEKAEAIGLVPFYAASSEQALRHRIGGASALRMQQQLAIPSTLALTDGDGGDVAGNLAALQDQLGDAWDIYPNGLTQDFLYGLDPDVWEKGGRAKSCRNALALRGVVKSKRRRKKDCGPRPCTKVLALPPSKSEERAQKREAQKASSIGANATDSGAIDLHPMFVNAPPQPALRGGYAGRSGRFARLEDSDDYEEGSWGRVEVEAPPVYRSHRRPRGMEEEQQWDALNVPFATEIKMRRPGEVSHERVWNIAAALAEKLPALTAG